MVISACVTLSVAAGAIPGGALPAALAAAGIAVGLTYPSRDLIVRAATPPGATGRVYGFVYSGLDVGSFATPVFYGWLMDHRLPHGLAEREQAMVAQDHRLGGLAEVARHAAALIHLERDALVVVVGDLLLHHHRVLADGQQAALVRRHRHAGARVGVEHAVDL